MEHKIQALGHYFSAMLMRDYQNAILGGSFYYICPRPARHFGRLFYLTLLLTGTLLLTRTNAAPAAAYTGAYYLTGLILNAIVRRRSGYSLVTYTFLNGLYAWILWGIIV